MIKKLHVATTLNLGKRKKEEKRIDSCRCFLVLEAGLPIILLADCNGVLRLGCSVNN